jgi:hypothetical protein
MKPRRATGDDGLATLSFVVLFPAVLFAVLLAVQAALWGHYQHLTVAAAQDAAVELAAEGGTNPSVTQVLADFGAGRLQGVRTSVHIAAGVNGPDRVEVTIDADAPALLGGFTLPVHARASAPVERFRP